MESLHSNCFLDKAGFDFDFLTFELLENVDSRRRPALASLVRVFIFKFSAAMTGSRLRFVVSRWSTVEWPNRIRYAVLGRTLSLPCLDDYLAVADRRLVNVVGPPVVAAGPFNPARIFFIFFRLTGEGEELRCLPR